MDIKEISSNIDKIKLDKETRDAIIALIDAKINNDMNTFSKELQASNESLKNKIDTEINSLKFTNKLMVGILIAILSAVIAVVIKTYF